MVMTREATTYCRICEPQCGLVATVEDGRLVQIRGDYDHVFSKGFHCTKAQAMVEITYDPERVTRPLRRNEAGEFEPCGWDEALDDVATRLDSIRRRDGAEAVAMLVGNPPSFSVGAMMFAAGLQATLGIERRYGINSDDGASRMGATALLYGSCGLWPRPDLWRTNLALLIGTNPLVSKGTRVSEPLIREALDGIIDRGGRVIVVDPRRTETARRYEHVAPIPGSDAWLLLGILHELLAGGYGDQDFLDRHTTGFATLKEMILTVELSTCASRSGVDEAAIRQIAEAFGCAHSAVVYGATGTCTQRFGTLNNMLQDLVMIVTGNVDREGGWLRGWGLVDFAAYAEASGLATFGALHTRVHRLPDVAGMLPSAGLAPDILEPGDGRIRALLNIGSNAVLTSGAGGGPQLAEALGSLELHISLDLYVNETNRYADYVLPVTGMYERPDFPISSTATALRPCVWATDAVIDPIGDSRHEWWILNEIVRRLGLGGAYAAPALRELAAAGTVTDPIQLINMMLSQSAHPELTFEALVQDHAHGLILRKDMPVGDFLDRLPTGDGRIHLDQPTLMSEVKRLLTECDRLNDPSYPLRLIGMREVRSHNSWMHNAPRLMPATRRQLARVNPHDAAVAGIADGEDVRIASPWGAITIPVLITDDVRPGVVAVPHGWGHEGGWTRANAAGGASSNLLSSHEPDEIEPIVGMSVLNGIPVRIDAVANP
jgi:formate dehydrogenase